ncbi:hypothetical protein BGW36DRAFT_403710 [Talaromyces proteolyticus]|uniref:Fungal N-terminal domain-containing protein n=1 Tax=Talaromyces proteolyticus TaxID=1131652 RepID=A0AAD4L2Z8_9EURO|nr:uncharacterized protein BGW36DRAFT_403710 [Talaromyces proteolyticus]KAH8703273.1 hypothetical protein BGW36DRAFT_403710 [Talaromyces proteolyticus]
MADPISISFAAIELIKQCAKIIKVIKDTVETARSAKEALMELLRQAERFRGLLQLARSLAGQARHGSSPGSLFQFNDSIYRQTLREITIFVNEVSRVTGDFRGGVWWITHKKQADGLVSRMATHEYEINSLLQSIAAVTSLRTYDEVKELSERVICQMEITTPFENLSVQGPSQSPTGDLDFQEQHFTYWLGETLQLDIENEYLDRRTKLSNAAYWGDWDSLFQIIHDAHAEFSESWINCIRLSKDIPKVYGLTSTDLIIKEPQIEADKVSGWTPLHQAVYMNASIDVVEKMISLGAWKAIRTFWTDDGEFPFKNMTPLEMARSLGLSHLFEVLSPVIRHNIPSEILQILEENFHGLIRADLGNLILAKTLRLPKLIVLIELNTPQMWFPVKLASNSLQGYFCILDQRELVVKSLGTHKSGQPQQYRISESGVCENYIH